MNMSGLGATARGMAGMSGMPSAAQLQQMQNAIKQAGSARVKTGAPSNAGAIMGAGLAGFTQADAEALVAFQQEMMQVAMLASTGDEAAKTRLEAWQALTLKHQGEIEKLSLTASAGDVASMQKLQQMQFTIMKEWASTAGPKLRVPKAKRP